MEIWTISGGASPTRLKRNRIQWSACEDGADTTSGILPIMSVLGTWSNSRAACLLLHQTEKKQ
uniref:Uncharacterized protein n=1 Tax=Pristionchus pacificus TaxID=54126 RepID=A0A2A6BRY4_PRIPA|eukprot:PDM68586.1 hypothetical protein PRIPAC_46888 [Pristionchus pacificus]